MEFPQFLHDPLSPHSTMEITDSISQNFSKSCGFHAIGPFLSKNEADKMEGTLHYHVNFFSFLHYSDIIKIFKNQLWKCMLDPPTRMEIPQFFIKIFIDPFPQSPRKMRSQCFKTDFDVKGSLGAVLFCVIIISSLYLESSTTSMSLYMIDDYYMMLCFIQLAT